MLGINREAAIFLSACLTGNLLYLCYCAIGVFRALVRHTLLWVSVEDMLFWVGAGIYLFLEIYRTCHGSIRWYYVLGVVLGAAVSYVLVRKIVKKRIAKIEKKR